MNVFLVTLLLAAQEPSLPGTVSSRLDPELKGQVLIEELNCAACHGGALSLAARSKKAPRLFGVGSRLNPAYLRSFLGDPRGTRPGTLMPDVLGGLGEAERNEVVAALTHSLASTGKGDFALEAPDAVAAERGRHLFHSRGCAACHSPRDERGVELHPGTSVPLGALERKYGFRGLVGFLLQPHANRPSGRMPEMGLESKEVESIAHYLLQGTRVPGALSYTLYRGPVWEGLGSDRVKAERAGQVGDFSLRSLGGLQQHTAISYEGWLNLPEPGRYTFFFEGNGGSLAVDGATVLQVQPSDRRGVKGVQGEAGLNAGWRRIQVVYFHTGREPKFSFEMAGPGLERQPIPSSMLSVSPAPIPVVERLKVDADLAARGWKQFGRLGCANCHDDLKVPPASAPAFAGLDSRRGCLSGEHGAWPDFGLNAEQRASIARALPRAEEPKLDDKQRLEKALVTFNCIACHDRDGLGGIAPERKHLFTGTRPEMGDQGRLPPPLTHVGAKLKPEWITEVLVNGKRQRKYIDASMPRFGEANMRALVDLFGRVDGLEAARTPPVADPRGLKDAGHLLIGTSGLSCIACHDFNGQRAAGAGALDLVGSTERLQKNWFHLYLRDPARFHPQVIMPTYWPDGKASLPGILGGDAAQQIEALWVYLEDGTRVRKPEGLSRQASELRVGVVAEICRGRSSVGYRGIGVGYPERINLAFDSQEMALRLLWKGEFANVDLGSFHPRGTDRISFPPGIPFHRLKSLEDHWPYKGKTDHSFPLDQGYRFSGYHLDALRRPTFQYAYGEVAVQDRFEDLRDRQGNAYFKRTLTFEAPAEQVPFHFRAAAGKSIAREADGSFRVGLLRMRIAGDLRAILREGDPCELLIPLAPPKGRSTVELEYQW